MIAKQNNHIAKVMFWYDRKALSIFRDFKVIGSHCDQIMHTFRAFYSGTFATRMIIMLISLAFALIRTVQK